MGQERDDYEDSTDRRWVPALPGLALALFALSLAAAFLIYLVLVLDGVGGVVPSN
jgi:hypothetical protein